MPGIENVGIIGGGLAGLALALALQQHSIPSTVYELRPEPHNIGGAITLSPNGLQILDTLGVYSTIVKQGISCNILYFRTSDDRVIDTFEVGSAEKYGYSGLRIQRTALIQALLDKCAEKGIPVEFGKKFTRILSESEHDVTWEFEDGTVGRATCLVGADGIHSRVRTSLFKDSEPRFTNVVAIMATISASDVQIPEGCQLPATIMNKDHGACIIAHEPPDGSTLVVLKQKRSPELGHTGWEWLQADKEECVRFLQEGAEDFPEIVRQAVAKIEPTMIFTWPFHQVPELTQWSSENGGVSIVGDAAHAIPPSSGQGANQVFEDAYTFALVCAQCDPSSLRVALPKWKQGRQQRVDRLIEFANQMNIRRLPGAMDRSSTDAIGAGAFQREWLFKPDLDRMVNEWMEL